VVVLVYVHFESQIRRQIYAKKFQAIQPGGYVILKAFHPRQAKLPSGGPDNTDLLVSADELRQDFSQGNILYLEEEEIEKTIASQENQMGIAVVTQMVARRPF